MAFHSGMTLVELLVSMAVASILMVALLQALTSASDSWTRQSRGLGAQREGRAAMRILADDLAAMMPIPRTIRGLSEVTLVPKEGGEPEAGSDLVPWEERADPDSELRTGFWLETIAGAGAHSRLAILRSGEQSPRTIEPGRGDLRLVLYGVVLTRDADASGLGGGKLTQKLVRRVLGPIETHRRLRLALSERRALVDPADWTGLLDTPAPGSDATVSVLAYDLVKFQIAAFEDLMTEAQVPAGAPTRMPRWLDITLRLTNAQTSQWLETAADWDGGGAEGRRLTNGTPNDFLDDVDVRTFTMRAALSPSANTL